VVEAIEDAENFLARFPGLGRQGFKGAADRTIADDGSDWIPIDRSIGINDLIFDLIFDSVRLSDDERTSDDD